MKLSAFKIVTLTIMLLALLTSALAVEYTEVTLTTFKDIRVWGGEEILPMVIQNNAPYPQNYMLQIDSSVGNWGTYRFEPSPHFTLAPGEKHQTYILLKADNNNFIGLQKFDLTIFSSNGDQRTIKMSANILKPAQEASKKIWPLLLAFMVIVLIGVFIVVIALVLIRKVTTPKQDLDSFDDFDDFVDDEPSKQDQKEDEFNEFDNFDDFDIFDEAESDKVDQSKSKDEELY